MDLIELRWLASNLVLPPAGPLLLAVLGLLLAGRSRSQVSARQRWARRLLILGVVCGWLCATPFLAQTLARWVEADVAALSDQALRAALTEPQAPGAVVILGGGVAFDERELPERETVNVGTLQRLAQGARLARISGLPILLSGGRPPRRTETEAALMARALRDSMGLEPRWLEDRARDTAGNARESARLLGETGVHRVVLVTQAYHMRRARAAFEAAGLQVLAAPHGFAGGDALAGGLASFVPSANATRLSWLALHEALGLVWYRLRGEA